MLNVIWATLTRNMNAEQLADAEAQVYGRDDVVPVVEQAGQDAMMALVLGH